MTELQSERRKGNWHRLWRPFFEGWAVLKDPNSRSQHIFAYWTRDQIRALGLYTSSEERRLSNNVVWQSFVLIQLAISIASLFYGIYESIGDIVNLGRDLVFTITCLFIVFRLAFFAQYGDDVDMVINALEDFHHRTIKGPGSKEVQTTKRLHFLLFMALLVIWLTFLVLFIFIKISTPFWMESQILPFHVAWPFHLHDPTKHPITHAIIFVSQSTTMLYYLIWLGFVENMGVSIFFELTSSLRVLSIELRNLAAFCQGDENLLTAELHRLTKFHQQIILLSEHCNDIFNKAFIMQMMVNFVLVSLSLFEVLAARKDPQVAAEYLVVMLMTLGHLSFWSKFGDMFSEESEQVAFAAYEAYDPTVGSKSIHRHFIFFIQRAQQPLTMSASPFPPFNLKNYMFILKQCYSILTVLTNTLD
ncbi:odorant receptor 65a-like [Drosophila subpulchrella]|uniref:odorant receptor 65a-like n=1 Tax=Drosophila subpulchrella TaxID=1486046 RepID=UPI0018A15437|nr:odorant receptor 65a-like [Drosophila subpulchrella]